MLEGARRAGIEDRETLVKLMAEFYAESGTPFDAGSAERAFQTLLKDDTLGRVWMLEHGGSPAGYAVMTVGFSMEFFGRDAFLDDLFVREAHRGQGLGRAAMEAVMAEGRRREARALHLEVARDNTAAKELYRRFGFCDTDRQLMTARLGTEDPRPMPPEVTLRDVIEEDLEVFFEHQQDPESNRMAAVPPRNRDAFLAHWKKILENDAVVSRTILLDGHVAGNLVSWKHDGIREVGYWIGREFWGKGAASRGLALFLEVLKPRPLYAYVAEHNAGSIRVLNRCGFTEAGNAPAAEPGPDGIKMRGFRLDGPEKGML